MLQNSRHEHRWTQNATEAGRSLSTMLADVAPSQRLQVQAPSRSVREEIRRQQTESERPRWLKGRLLRSAARDKRSFDASRKNARDAVSTHNSKSSTCAKTSIPLESSIRAPSTSCQHTTRSRSRCERFPSMRYQIYCRWLGRKTAKWQRAVSCEYRRHG